MVAAPASALIYHPSVSHFLRYAATTIGRDKLLRIVQYFSRFYAWYLFRTNNPQISIAPFEALKKDCGLARRLMRMGKFMEHLRLAATAADAKGGDEILRICGVGRQLGYATYMLMDNATYIDTVALRKFSTAKRMQKLAYEGWMVGLLFNIMGGIYTQVQLLQRARETKKTDGEGALDERQLVKERNAASLQLLCDVCDITVPAFGLGYGAGILDDGLVGLLGVVSSAIGIRTMWKKTA